MTECGACLSIGDDHGDNSGTITCQLEEGHSGPHQEKFTREDCGAVMITWEKDERTKCSWCGKLTETSYWCESSEVCEKKICPNCVRTSTVHDQSEYMYCPEHFKAAVEKAQKEGSNK